MAYNPNLLDPDLVLRGVQTMLQRAPATAIKVKTPEEVAQEREELRNRKAIADFNTLRVTEAQREAETARQLQDIFARSGGDWNTAEEDAARIDPEVAFKVRKLRLDALSAQNAEFESRMQSEAEGAQRVAALVSAAEQNPAQWPTFRQQILARLPEDARAGVPEQFDPAAAVALKEAALTVQQQLARTKDNRDLLLKGDWKTGLFGLLADADDENEWNNIIESHKTALPKGALAMIPKWTPDAPDKIARILIGPKGLADIERAEARDVVLERQGEARLTIARNKALRAGGGGSGADDSDFAVIADAYMKGNKDAVRGLSGQDLRKVNARILRAGGTPAAGGGEGGALPPRVETTVRGLATRFSAEPAVRRTVTMGEAVNFVNSLDVKTTNPADDQALIYAFAKAMDPESVVREGEYATVAKYAQSWLSQFGFDAMRVLSSNTPILTPQARANLKKTITSRYNASRGSYDNLERSYVSQINKATGLDDARERLTDYGAVLPPAPGGAARETTGGATTGGRVTATPSDYSAYLNRKKGGA